MTAAQAAKIEAKRAEKAAKAAAKAAAKKDKKKGQGLGMGCSELRQRVLGAGTSGAGGVGLETAEIEGKLNPFHVGEVSKWHPAGVDLRVGQSCGSFAGIIGGVLAGLGRSPRCAVAEIDGLFVFLAYVASCWALGVAASFK